MACPVHQHRARHGLELTAVLIAGEIRQKMSQAWELHRDEHVANLDRSRNPDRARADAAEVSVAGRESGPSERGVVGEARAVAD